MQPFDLVIRGGTVATATDSMKADVGIRGETVAAIGEGLDQGKREVDARGKFVLPGGVDVHAHIEQISSAAGILNSDTFESATRAAAFGGTTSVICFAAQQVGGNLTKTVEDYHALADRGASIDYAFHMILADPNEATLKNDVPPLVKAGHASLKVFMSYDRLRVTDEQLLDVLYCARENGAFVCVHAENHGMITWMSQQLLKGGNTAPKFHGVAHPRVCEAEAINRLVACAQIVDQPIMVFHVSTEEGCAIIRQKRGEGLKVFGETCPQYLFLTRHDLDKPGHEGAKWMFSPPARETADQEAIWQALGLGDLQLVSSDHAPYAYDPSGKTGKFSAGSNPTFKQIANGMPGVTPRMSLMFDAMVSKGRGGINRFVAWTATEPAKMYGLHPKKGSIAIGQDADIAVWDPEKKFTFSDDTIKDGSGYTPYAGRTVTGWPITVVRRGDVIVDSDSHSAKPGSGRFLARKAGWAAEPLGRPSPEFNPKTNFGAKFA